MIVTTDGTLLEDHRAETLPTRQGPQAAHEHASSNQVIVMPSREPLVVWL